MTSDRQGGGVEVLSFSNDRMEGYLDLLENDEHVDPLYGRGMTRDMLKSKFELQTSAGVIIAHLVAVENGRVVGTGKANSPPACGEEEGETATLSLVISPLHKGRGLRKLLLDRICEELVSRNVDWIEMGTLDIWEDMNLFLKENGFEPCMQTADAVLGSDVSVRTDSAGNEVSIRPIRLPDEKDAVLSIYHRERAEDLPRECAIAEGQPAWWELPDLADNFSPEGFLVAEEKETGEIVGYASAFLLEEGGIQGLLSYHDVARRYLGKGLRERLLVQVISWLRKNGVSEIHCRVHLTYRNEGELIRRLGFEMMNSATVWRRQTATIH